MDIETLSQKIENGFVWAQREGYRLIDKKCGSRKNHCGCALSFALWGDGDHTVEPNIEVYMEHFGMTEEQVGDFMVGFDDLCIEEDDETRTSDFYKLGTQYRLRLSTPR